MHGQSPKLRTFPGEVISGEPQLYLASRPGSYALAAAGERGDAPPHRFDNPGNGRLRRVDLIGYAAFALLLFLIAEISPRPQLAAPASRITTVPDHHHSLLGSFAPAQNEAANPPARSIVATSEAVADRVDPHAITRVRTLARSHPEGELRPHTR
jgi:hypothetical protein